MEFKIIFNFLSVCTGNFLAAASYTIANPIYPSEVKSKHVESSYKLLVKEWHVIMNNFKPLASQM